jgi:hypothetical protein
VPIFQEDKSIAPDGPVSIWRLPSATEDYVIGADVAEGYGHGDNSSAHVLSVQNWDVVATWHGRVPANDYGDQLNLLGRFYNTALMGVENNGPGLATISRLRHLNYPRIFRQRSADDETTHRIENKLGWTTTRKSKPKMIEDLHTALNDGSLTIPCKHTIAELLTFVRDDRGKMQGSPHDDRVISLAIAVQMLGFAHTSEFNKPEQRPRWSRDWWSEQAKNANKEPEFRLGMNAGRDKSRR